MSVQDVIDSMHGGNRELIIRSLSSPEPILVMNAMLAGMEHGMQDDAYLSGVVRHVHDRTRLMGWCIGHVALAVLHVTERCMYTGSDEEVLRLIRAWI